MAHTDFSFYDVGHRTSKSDRVCCLIKLMSFQINKLSYGLDPNFVEPAEITQKVVQGIHAGKLHL